MSILKTLERRKIKFILPIPVCGKSGGTRIFFETSASHKNTYTFNIPKHGELKVSLWRSRSIPMAPQTKRAYADSVLPKSVEPHQVFEMCRQ
jgi:hypothetical protein